MTRCVPDSAATDVKIRNPAAIMRLLYYPALGEEKADELALGIGVSAVLGNI